VTQDGDEVGTVSAIHNFGASDLIEIKALAGELAADAVHRCDSSGNRSRRAAHRDRASDRERIDMWRATVLTIFPDMFPGPLAQSLAGKALTSSIWSLETIDIRAHATDKHRTVDDTPAGGGPGMVMKADVLARALDAVPHDTRPRLLMSPRGTRLTQSRAAQLAHGLGAVIVCARFEGVDERLIRARRMEEISLGDFVLSGGEIAALALMDACVRLLPGVMGKEASAAEESFADGLLEYPQYTRPPVFEGEPIPDVLTSGGPQESQGLATGRGPASDCRAPARPVAGLSGAKKPQKPAGIQRVTSRNLCNTSSPTLSDQSKTARRLLALPTENSR
jgi:tRNA (guanine37-N1)-methyltransferase